MELGADLSAQDFLGRTPLHLAARKGHADLVVLLANLGSDINHADKNPWPNNSGRTPMHWACYKGHAEVVLRVSPFSIPVPAPTRAHTPPWQRAEKGAPWRARTQIAALRVRGGQGSRGRYEANAIALGSAQVTLCNPSPFYAAALGCHWSDCVVVCELGWGFIGNRSPVAGGVAFLLFRFHGLFLAEYSNGA